MCIVIDTDTLSRVFNNSNKEHPEFIPVYNWIIKGKGKMAIGGSKYDIELEAVTSLTKLIVELSKANKVRIVDSDLVDRKEKELKVKVVHKDFDDPHIVAIVIVSGIHLICTHEKRAIPFLTRNDFYPGRRVPQIYSKSANANLLANNTYCRKCNITCKKTNKDTSSHLEATKEQFTRKKKKYGYQISS
jgi:hypothetical protein